MLVSTAFRLLSRSTIPAPVLIRSLSDAARRDDDSVPCSFAVDSRGQPFIHRHDSIHQLLVLTAQVFELLGEI